MRGCVSVISTTDSVRDVRTTCMCCPPYITGSDPGSRARLIHVACMPHMHLTAMCDVPRVLYGEPCSVLWRTVLRAVVNRAQYSVSVLLGIECPGVFPKTCMCRHSTGEGWL